MRLFDRAIRVTVGPEAGDGVRFDQAFRIAFQIDQDETASGNNVQIEVYGLSPDTRAQIQQREQIVLVEAGYGDQLEILAIAEVDRVITRREPPEIVTTIEAIDGGASLVSIRVNVSYEPGYSVRQVIDQIADQAALPVRVAPGVDLQQSYETGAAFSGTVKRALDQALARVPGVDWSVQDDEIVLRRPGEPTDQSIVVLSPSSGLVRSPERLEDQNTDGWQVESLLQPRIRPGANVRIESADVNADTVVRRVSHQGDTRGNDWLSTAEVVAR